MRRPLLHIGFHKSGSTTLQEALFSRHSQVANLGEPVENPDALAAMRNAWEACCDDATLRTPFKLEYSQSLWRKALENVPPEKLPVFSKERLTRFGYCGAPDCLPAKLHAIVGPAQIVIVIRNQIKLIESLYYAKTDGDMTPDRWRTAETEGPQNRDRFHVYRYHAFAKAYADVFGRENVGIFMLEELATDVESFARKLCNFIGIDGDEGSRLLRNKRLHSRTSQRGLAYAKLRSVVGRNIHLGVYAPKILVQVFSNFLSRGKPVAVELPRDWIEHLKSFYRTENARLAAEWGLPLQEYGYPL
ncbi:MAG TPA: sulfotransferase [Bryobacteraceae bacterium]|nr:sulfotransferase [Bryobacteraceae bacterium]